MGTGADLWGLGGGGKCGGGGERWGNGAAEWDDVVKQCAAGGGARTLRAVWGLRRLRCGWRG